jgi:hypothetical protein
MLTRTKFGIALTPLFTALAYMSGVGPNDALSNLSQWYALVTRAASPSWLSNPLVDLWGTALFCIAALVSFFWLIWPYRNVTISWRRNRQEVIPASAAIQDQNQDTSQNKSERFKDEAEQFKSDLKTRAAMNRLALTGQLTQSPRYTDRERADRYDAWSRIYRALNTECSAALDSGSLVSNTWKEEIINATPNGYRERMDTFRRMASKSLNEIRAIYCEYEYLTDIRDYFENSWGSFQGILWEASNIFSDTLKRLPEKPTHNLVSLVEPQAQEYRKGVKAFGKWITEAKTHAAAKIKELSRD